MQHSTAWQHSTAQNSTAQHSRQAMPTWRGTNSTRPTAAVSFPANCCQLVSSFWLPSPAAFSFCSSNMCG